MNKKILLVLFLIVAISESQFVNYFEKKLNTLLGKSS